MTGKKGSKKVGAAIEGAKTIFDLDLGGWIGQVSDQQKSKKTGEAVTQDAIEGRLIIVSSEQSETLTPQALALKNGDLPGWQWERAVGRRGEVIMVLTSSGPIWLAQLSLIKEGSSHSGLFDQSAYGQARDLAGQAAILALDYGITCLNVEGIKLNEHEQRGVTVGLELGAYRFKVVRQGSSLGRPPLRFKGFRDDLKAESQALGMGTNLARHLVNLPAGDLNPKTYADALKSLFSGSKTMTVDVWQGLKLAQEKCNLLVAVGRAAAEPAALVRLSYRPKGKTKLQRPIAFVGKGVTFDTGGIDLKDADSMRLMKKDMGGSAALAGLAFYLEEAKVDVACDIYLALAENAIDGLAIRPGDVLVARNGQTVEIHNTDAEGRLVLADAIDVALTRKGEEAPLALIDLATLTGAMRVALGTKIGGLFANDDVLADQLLKAGQKAGDPCWRMPLFKDYNSQLKTAFADVANATQSRFGGAITAALFLQRFVRDARWAHIDLYTWTDGNTGGMAEAGGSGQGVQVLAQFLRDLQATF